MKAHLRQIRISPKKANLIAALVRGKNAQEAIGLLEFTPKKFAPMLAKLIKSAVANATHNENQKAEDLSIKEIIVNEGATYKRRIMISRGRAHPILKRTSHVTVVLETKGKAAPKAKAAKPKTEEAAAPKKEEAPAKETKEETKKTPKKKTTTKK
jgi:large subunit ribosomal protein L22